MEMAEAKEKKLATMKKNLKLIAVALVVLAIEKITEMMVGLFNSTDSDEGLAELNDKKCWEEAPSSPITMYHVMLCGSLSLKSTQFSSKLSLVCPFKVIAKKESWI